MIAVTFFMGVGPHKPLLIKNNGIYEHLNLVVYLTEHTLCEVGLILIWF
jgi:hypothetical protein